MKLRDSDLLNSWLQVSCHVFKIVVPWFYPDYRVEGWNFGLKSIFNFMDWHLENKYLLRWAAMRSF